MAQELLAAEKLVRGGDQEGNAVYPCNFLTGAWAIHIQSPSSSITYGFDATLEIQMASDCSGVSSAVITFPQLGIGSNVVITLFETTTQAYQPAKVGLGAYYDIYILTLYGYTPDWSCEIVLTCSTGSFAFGYCSGTATIWSYGSQEITQYNGNVSGNNTSISHS